MKCQIENLQDCHLSRLMSCPMSFSDVFVVFLIDLQTEGDWNPHTPLEDFP